jgi:hypothetical protein
MRARGVTPCIINLGFGWRSTSLSVHSFLDKKPIRVCSFGRRLCGAQSRSGKSSEEEYSRAVVQPTVSQFTDLIIQVYLKPMATERSCRVGGNVTLYSVLPGVRALAQRMVVLRFLWQFLSPLGMPNSTSDFANTVSFHILTNSLLTNISTIQCCNIGWWRL